MTIRERPAQNAGLDAVRISHCLSRIVSEYQALPGLVLTPAQMQRVWAMNSAECAAVIDALTTAHILRRTACGAYAKDEDWSISLDLIPA